ncbi:hypothetical protein BU23DRAFT_568851 [Bimuria novae-zelandiae CBS 107.79]|uniref:Uncharacterized protein n=1 Tax=Bimuria novae-zelandiae CBS 107.79 TaxID=1447943 RepID=A0A6A5V5B3_9PLEO|nr:hypothetical protein BU23DRAFT_568851 [Bimuria novae-zelandiae CBS 107.79]
MPENAKSANLCGSSQKYRVLFYLASSRHAAPEGICRLVHDQEDSSWLLRNGRENEAARRRRVLAALQRVQDLGLDNLVCLWATPDVESLHVIISVLISIPTNYVHDKNKILIPCFFFVSLRNNASVRRRRLGAKLVNVRGPAYIPARSKRPALDRDAVQSSSKEVPLNVLLKNKISFDVVWTLPPEIP